MGFKQMQGNSPEVLGLFPRVTTRTLTLSFIVHKKSFRLLLQRLKSSLGFSHLTSGCLSTGPALLPQTSASWGSPLQAMALPHSGAHRVERSCPSERDGLSGTLRPQGGILRCGL